MQSLQRQSLLLQVLWCLRFLWTGYELLTLSYLVIKQWDPGFYFSALHEITEPCFNERQVGWQWEQTCSQHGEGEGPREEVMISKWAKSQLKPTQAVSRNARQTSAVDH